MSQRLAVEAPVGLQEIGRHEARVADAVQRRVAHGARDEPGLAFDAEQLARALRERQAEVAEPAVEIEHAVRGLDGREPHGRRDELGVYVRVDLHEVRRQELAA